MVSDTAHIRAMAERLQHGITSQCDGVVLNGPQSTDHRYVGNMNLSFSYVEGESLIMGLKVLLTCSAGMTINSAGDSLSWGFVLCWLPVSARVSSSCASLLQRLHQKSATSSQQSGETAMHSWPYSMASHHLPLT